jgi:anti-anti-sigma factor
MNHLTPPRNGAPAGRGYPPSLAWRDPAPCSLRHLLKPGDGMAVSVQGELDLGTRTVFQEALEQAVTSCTGDVSLALAECTFMDTSTLGVIINQAAELDAQGRRLTIDGYSGQVSMILRATGMDGSDLITFVPGVEQRATN